MCNTGYSSLQKYVSDVLTLTPLQNVKPSARKNIFGIQLFSGALKSVFCLFTQPLRIKKYLIYKLH